MTTAAVAPTAQVPEGFISCTIDGIAMVVPKDTLIIRAAEQIGIEIPRFCDHPLLSPVAACRMCLVEIVGQPKPQPACAVMLTDGMEVKTQVTSEVAEAAQAGVMEFLLINHPLDCPICDKGGECPLQNQAMSAGRPESRFNGVKRTFPKPINVSSEVLLDRERCVSCARCTRFADEIAGDPFIELFERGAKQQIGIAADEPFDSYFSGNTVQICPVGALTSAGYRFRARPFDLVSTPTGCEHCASGCAQRTDHRRDLVMRRLAGDDPLVNEEWNCDKGRFAFVHFSRGRITTPMVRDANGVLQDASWPEAIAAAAAGLKAAGSDVGVLPGGRLTAEDAYAYAKFARAVLGTDDIDFRARPGTDEEVAFLTARVAGSAPGAVSYDSLESAPIVLLAGLEPEEESPIILLRLRKGVLAGTTSVAAIAPWASPAYVKTKAALLPAVPGQEGQVLSELAGAADAHEGAADRDPLRQVAAKLREPGAVILVGERLALAPGALSAAVALAGQTGAALAWVPRRAGERGALDGGALAGLLPGGRLIADPGARAEVAAAWGLDADALPSTPGRTAEAILAEPPAALLIGGVDPDDTADPRRFREVLASDTFVVSLEQRLSAVTDSADVVLPVAADVERTGSYTNWEGRSRVFGRVNPDAFDATDAQVLSEIAAAISPAAGAAMGDCRTAELAAELLALGRLDESRPPMPTTQPTVAPRLAPGQAVLSSWHHLLDAGVLQAGEPYLAATARPARVRMSAETAASIGADEGQLVRVTGPVGEMAFPLEVTEMPDQVVWVPTNSFPPGETFPAPDEIGRPTSIHAVIGATAGDIVGIAPVTSSIGSLRGAS